MQHDAKNFQKMRKKVTIVHKVRKYQNYYHVRQTAVPEMLHTCRKPQEIQNKKIKQAKIEVGYVLQMQHITKNNCS